MLWGIARSSHVRQDSFTSVLMSCSQYSPVQCGNGDQLPEVNIAIRCPLRQERMAVPTALLVGHLPLRWASSSRIHAVKQIDGS